MFLEILIFSLISLSLGSFSNNYISSIVNERRIDLFRSYCFCGEKKLKGKDLIPLFSFILINGRCAYCNEKLSYRYLIVELFSLIAGLAAYLSDGFTVTALLLMAFLIGLINIGTIDLEKLIIPDLMVVIVLLSGFGMKIIASNINLLNLSAGIVIFILLLLIKYYGIRFMKKDYIGMGDIKLITALFFVVGFPVSLIGLWMASLLGVAENYKFAGNELKVRKIKVPFGFYLALTFAVAKLFENNIFNFYVGLFY